MVTIILTLIVIILSEQLSKMIIYIDIKLFRVFTEINMFFGCLSVRF